MSQPGGYSIEILESEEDSAIIIDRKFIINKNLHFWRLRFNSMVQIAKTFSNRPHFLGAHGINLWYQQPSTSRDRQFIIIHNILNKVGRNPISLEHKQLIASHIGIMFNYGFLTDTLLPDNAIPHKKDILNDHFAFLNEHKIIWVWLAYDLHFYVYVEFVHFFGWVRILGVKASIFYPLKGVFG